MVGTVGTETTNCLTLYSIIGHNVNGEVLCIEIKHTNEHLFAFVFLSKRKGMMSGTQGIEIRELTQRGYQEQLHLLKGLIPTQIGQLYGRSG